MEPTTDWTGIAHTDVRAKPTSWTQVEGVLAVRVECARIRGAEVSGVFAVSDHPEPITVHGDGTPRAEVHCLWFGRKPPTSWMHLTLAGKWQLVRSYTGPVVENIS